MPERPEAVGHGSLLAEHPPKTATTTSTGRTGSTGARNGDRVTRIPPWNADWQVKREEILLAGIEWTPDGGHRSGPQLLRRCRVFPAVMSWDQVREFPGNCPGIHQCGKVSGAVSLRNTARNPRKLCASKAGPDDRRLALPEIRGHRKSRLAGWRGFLKVRGGGHRDRPGRAAICGRKCRKWPQNSFSEFSGGRCHAERTGRGRKLLSSHPDCSRQKNIPGLEIALQSPILCSLPGGRAFRSLMRWRVFRSADSRCSRIQPEFSCFCFRDSP